jgi:hypothetical protein
MIKRPSVNLACHRFYTWDMWSLHRECGCTGKRYMPYWIGRNPKISHTCVASLGFEVIIDDL